MKTISNQTDVADRRTRVEYDPERHYVAVQKPEGEWDGPQLDRLLDETLADGTDAYRIEADGEKDRDQRRMTGHRHMVILSCPKEHMDQKMRAAAKASHANAHAIKPNADFEEKLDYRAAISVDDIPSKPAHAA
jgi:hypothetical protein